MKKVALICSAIIFLILITSCKSKILPEELYPAVDKNEKWGYIDKNGEFFITPIYDFAQGFNENGLAFVGVNAKDREYDNYYNARFINKKGDIVAGPFRTFEPIEAENNMLIMVNKDQESFVVDSDAKVVFKYSEKIIFVNEKMACFVTYNDEREKTYGYINIKNNKVLKPIYKNANPFRGGKALVMVEDDQYAIINKNGFLLKKSYSSLTLKEPSEGLRAYWNEYNQKYGYKSTNGSSNDEDIAIKPQYRYAGAFKDGFAIVNAPEDKFKPGFGLINRAGEYLIQPKYTGIKYLGRGLYAVSNGEHEYMDKYLKKAIFNNKGERLTEFAYLNVQRFNGEYASAYNETSTFFINTKGEAVDELPVVDGIGSLAIEGSLISAKVDERFFYISHDGKIIWEKDNTIRLDDEIEVEKIYYRKDFKTLIIYPRIKNLPNKDVENNINNKLKDIFTKNHKIAKEKNKTNVEDILIKFSVQINKDLLIVKKEGEHFLPASNYLNKTKTFYHIDLIDATIYSLSDLFADRQYPEKLTTHVREQILINQEFKRDEIKYFNEYATVYNNHNFRIDSDSLVIYYQPFEIALDKYGFPEFKISYHKITDIIDTKGEFWNSFNRKEKEFNIVFSNKIEDIIVSRIKELIDSYENKYIKAVNTKDFNALKPVLVKDSQIYDFQNLYIKSISQNKIKKTLKYYDIYMIEEKKYREKYNVYIKESIISTSTLTADIENSMKWIYTVEFDELSRCFNLTGIEQWEL